MKEEVLLQLALAKQYAHHARFAGTPRQAVADGYSAVDAMLSALLVHSGQEPPRNHKVKFETAQKVFPNAFAAEIVRYDHGSSYAPGADWTSLGEFYKQWLASRYQEFDMDPGVASSRVREANAAVSSGIRFLAKAEKMGSDALDEAASVRAFGYKYSETSIAVGDVHDILFDQAERYGEEYGSRLGTKLAATTNYCDLDLVAGDRLTQRIILEDKEIAVDAAQLYHAFVQLVDKIQEKRLERICEGRPIENCTPEQVIDATDFMVSLKARYHGGTFPLFGVPWSQLLKGVLSNVSRTLKTSIAEIAQGKQANNAAEDQTGGGTATGAPS
jgi:hypothetical protein